MNWDAYSEGFLAWELWHNSDFSPEYRTVNPYKENTPEFMSWRIGWNHNFNGI